MTENGEFEYEFKEGRALLRVKEKEKIFMKWRCFALLYTKKSFLREDDTRPE
jgi:hypothetical protein